MGSHWGTSLVIAIQNIPCHESTLLKVVFMTRNAPIPSVLVSARLGGSAPPSCWAAASVPMNRPVEAYVLSSVVRGLDDKDHVALLQIRLGVLVGVYRLTKG